MKKKRAKLSTDDLIQLEFWAGVALLLGGRVKQVVFTDWSAEIEVRGAKPQSKVKPKSGWDILLAEAERPPEFIIRLNVVALKAFIELIGENHFWALHSEALACPSSRDYALWYLGGER